MDRGIRSNEKNDLLIKMNQNEKQNFIILVKKG